LIASAVIAAKAGDGQSGTEILLSATLLLVLFWVAHVYADVLGERLETRERPGWSTIVRAGLRDWSMLRGSLIPIVVFAVVDWAGASVNTAVLTSLWLTIVLLALWGLVAAVRGGARGAELLLETLVCAALGFAVLVLKIFIH
jgi:hypothetical protein